MAKNDKQVKNKKDDSLTLAQETFVQELIKGLTQRKAYLVAYPRRKHWKEKTIDEKASRLFGEDKIKARFNEVKQKLIKEAEDECIIDAKEILREYKKIAFSDITDYLEYKTEVNMVDVGEGMQVPKYSQIINMKDSKDVDGAVIQEVSINQSGTFSFKLHNKIKALDKLYDHINKNMEEDDDEEDADGLEKAISESVGGVWNGEKEEEE